MEKRQHGLFEPEGQQISQMRMIIIRNQEVDNISTSLLCVCHIDVTLLKAPIFSNVIRNGLVIAMYLPIFKPGSVV